MLFNDSKLLPACFPFTEAYGLSIDVEFPTISLPLPLADCLTKGILAGSWNKNILAFSLSSCWWLAEYFKQKVIQNTILVVFNKI